MEEAQVLLEDQIVKSQAMAASPFSKPFEDRLVPWEQKLQRFQVGFGTSCGYNNQLNSTVMGGCRSNAGGCNVTQRLCCTRECKFVAE